VTAAVVFIYEDLIMFARHPYLLGSAAALSVSVFADGPSKRVLHRAETPLRVQPTRAAQSEFVDGRLILTSDWVELGATTRNPPNTYAYDAFEGDENGVPTDDAPFGCTPFMPPGARWLLGNTYNNPFWSNDMTTGPAAHGLECEGINLAWFWNIDPVSGYDDSDGDGILDQVCYMAVLTSETFGFQCEDYGLNSLLPGVIYEFANLRDCVDAQQSGFLYTTIDLTGTGLFHAMPADGVGGHIVMYGTAYNPGTGEFTLARGEGDVWAQPMLWCTDDAEPPGGSERIGTQEAIVYENIDPDEPPSSECYEYSFGVCPDPLGACIGFLYKSQINCLCAGDTNGDGIVDLADLSELLSTFGTQCPCPNPCVDVNGDEQIDIADLGILLSQFGGVCP
jgi:hypothetical protein